MGILYLLESGLLELRQLMRTEMGPVKGAGPGCCPVFAMAVGALDSLVPRIGVGHSSVCA